MSRTLVEFKHISYLYLESLVLNDKLFAPLALIGVEKIVRILKHILMRVDYISSPPLFFWGVIKVLHEKPGLDYSTSLAIFNFTIFAPPRQ